MNENIAIYGGAFNPPTLGHKGVITQVIENTPIEKIILAPDGERLDKDYGINNEDKKKLINLFFEDLRKEKIEIELDTHFLEGKNNGPTNTIEVDQYFRKELRFSPYYIFGSDTIGKMNNWVGNEGGYIEKKLKKIFISRPGYELNTTGIDNFLTVEAKLSEDISSTVVREMIKNKGKVGGILMNPKKLLIPEIEKYIKKHNLYHN